MRINNIFVHNWFAILYFNFKMLPFKQAIRLPFDFYGKIRFQGLTGRVILDTHNLKIGCIKIGSQGCDMFPKSETVLTINGEWLVKGKFILGMGSSLIIKRGGRFSCGDGVNIGPRSLVFCQEDITLNENFLSSWDCQIMDTDTHQIIDLSTNRVNEYIKPVLVGSDVWIGNGVIINKGCILASNTIVASRSLCNKDYSSEGCNCILAGAPAKIVARNKSWKK